MRVLSSVLLAMSLAQVPAPLVGIWVQDNSGPVLIHQRRYEFKADGSYELTLTQRPRGSTNQEVLARETGTFRVQGDRLTIAPKSGDPKTFPWRVERDRFIGTLQLVLMLPDGTLDVYYPQ